MADYLVPMVAECDRRCPASLGATPVTEMLFTPVTPNALGMV